MRHPVGDEAWKSFESSYKFFCWLPQCKTWFGKWWL